MTTRLRTIAEPFVVALPEIHLRKPGDPKARGRPQQRRRTRRPTGIPRVTRWARTVRGHPPGRTHYCSVFRNGAAIERALLSVKGCQ